MSVWSRGPGGGAYMPTFWTRTWCGRVSIIRRRTRPSLRPAGAAPAPGSLCLASRRPPPPNVGRWASGKLWQPLTGWQAEATFDAFRPPPPPPAPRAHVQASCLASTTSCLRTIVEATTPDGLLGISRPPTPAAARPPAPAPAGEAAAAAPHDPPVHPRPDPPPLASPESSFGSKQRHAASRPRGAGGGAGHPDSSAADGQRASEAYSVPPPPPFPRPSSFHVVSLPVQALCDSVSDLVVQCCVLCSLSCYQSCKGS